MSSDSLKNNLLHSRVAYLHAIRALPSQQDLRAGTITQHGFEFSRPDQIESQVIELGWAFFPRYEACLEKWLKEQGVHLSKKLTLTDWLAQSDVRIPDEFSEGLGVYRRIRNSLHHDDGASFDGSSDSEIHLMPEHMERFFNLFCWIGERVEAVRKFKHS